MQQNKSPTCFGRAMPVRKLKDKRKRQILLLVCLLPFLAMVALFSYVPLFGWGYAFINYKPGVSMLESTFVGLKYFRAIFSGTSDFWVVLRNTLCISLFNLACSVIPAVFAVMISQAALKKFSRVVQTLTSIPNFISWVIVYSMVFLILSSEDSPLNTLLLQLGIVEKPTNILIDVNAAWLVQVAIVVWKSTGYGAIIYLAAISGIDQELYNAAEVDGAGTLQKILHVTVPGIMPTYFVLLVLSISNMLSNGFEQYWLFGNGMTWDRLEVFDTYVYRMGIQNMEYSLATAMGMFKSIISVLLLSIANLMSKKIRQQSIF